MVMQTKITWKKNFFSNLYTIYSNGQQIGKLKEKTFSQTANGELNGKEYTFTTKGFFKQHTSIIDCSTNEVIGEIIYNNWMTKATIIVDNKKVNWKYDNLWNTKWSIYNSEGVHIKYAGSSTSGQIDSNVDDALLLLSGLFVTNYYWQMTVAVLVAALVPIWSTALR
jgi:hypothetical protein